MATLSKRQQGKIERMWELEDQQRSNLIAMAKRLKGLHSERRVINAEMERIFSQVPPSAEELWAATDTQHQAFVETKKWMNAYQFIRELLDSDR